MNILGAIDDPLLFRRHFKDPVTWNAWRACLCALFALPMSETELATYRQCTGRAAPPDKPFQEAWLNCGRRSGKSFTLALVAVYLACFKEWRPYLTAGEIGHVVVIAADRRQARTIMDYIRALILETPMLAALVRRETAGELELNNRITLEVATCSFRTIRGRTVIAALCDEISFWLDSETSTCPDVEVLAALRPAMATVPGSMLLCASSPYAKRGAMYDAFTRWHGQEDAQVLVWHAATRTMNPTLPQRVIDDAFALDPQRAASEYDAVFRSDVQGFVTDDVLESCIDAGVFERPPDKLSAHVAFCDPSGGLNDSMTLGVAHMEPGGLVVLDLLREQVPPFSPAATVEEFCKVIRSYGLTSVHGDKYGALWVAETFSANGVSYLPAELNKSELYIELLPLMNSGQVVLLDNQKLRRQFLSLERRTARGGRDTVDHLRGGHDDLSNAACGAAVLAQQGRAVSRVSNRSIDVSHWGAIA